MNLTHSDGVGAAWIMATVGHTRRLSKKDITSVSIPQVCRLVQKQKLLRLALNLMYGLALLHKQQVNYVFEDVANVHQKLTRPVFFGQVEEKAVVHQRRHVPLPDSGSFTMQDFACDEWFLERKGFRYVEECFDTYISHAQRADALDKLLDDILDQTLATLRANETTLGEVGFEFDENGEINSQAILSINQDLAGLEADFEDLRRDQPARDHSKDPHFSTTLNILRSTLNQRESRPKRKHIVCDPVAVHTAYSFCYPLYLREFDTLPSVPKRRKQSIWETLGEMSLTAAPYLNQATQLYLEPPPGTIPPSRLPQWKARTDDVELGRNVQILADTIEFARASMLDFEPDDTFESFTLNDKTLEDASFQFPSSQVESQGTIARNLHKLALKLLGYIHNRSFEYGSFCDWEGNQAPSGGYRKISFVDLFPPQPLGPSDLSVTRKLAAKSFGTVLELATKNALQIIPGDEPAAEKAWVLHSYDDGGDHNVLANIT